MCVFINAIGSRKKKWNKLADFLNRSTIYRSKKCHKAYFSAVKHKIF